MKKILALLTAFLLFNTSLFAAGVAEDVILRDQAGHYLNINADGTIPTSGGGGTSNTNYTGFNTSDYPIATGWVKSLVPTSGNTVAGGYDAITTGAADFGGGGTTEKHFLTYSHKNRIRQKGNLSQVKFYTVTVPAAVTAFYIEVWRQADPAVNSFALVAQSADIKASLADATTNTVTLASTIAVEEGDFVGYSYTASSDPGNFLDSITGASNSTYSTTSAYTSTAYAWKSQTSQTNILPMQLYVDTAPLFVAFGDSIISGYEGSGGTAVHRSFLEATDNTNVTNHISYYVAQMLSAGGTVSGVTYQNMGVSGDGLGTSMRTRAAADVVALNPKFVIMDGGENDVIASDDIWKILVNLTKNFDILDAANIPVFFMGIPPREGATTAQKRVIKKFNQEARKICEEQFSQCYFVDVTKFIGEYDNTSDFGNLFNFRGATLYDSSDGAHPNTLGKKAIASAFVMKIAEVQHTFPYGNSVFDVIPPTKRTTGSLFSVLADPRLALTWISNPRNQDSTTETDLSGNSNTGTYGVLENEVWLKGDAWLMDGATSNQVTIADSASLSFGNSTVDEPFSIVAFIEYSDQASSRVIFSKYNPASGAEKREYQFYIDSAEKLNMELFDETTNVAASRITDAAVASSANGTFHTVIMSYDGTGGATAANGITFYVDGVLVASTATNNASYVAMNNTTQGSVVAASRSTAGSLTNWMLEDWGAVYIFGSATTADNARSIDMTLRSLYKE